MKKRRSSGPGITKTTTEKASEAEPAAEAQDGATDTCDACGAAIDPAEVTARADGTPECGSCGAPLELAAVERVTKAEAAAPSPAVKKADLPRCYCDQCGAEWMRGPDDKPMPSCGHTEGFVRDPSKAKNYGPPAGLARDQALVAKSKAAEAAPPAPASAAARPQPKAVEASTSTGATIVQVGERIVGEWGKSMFRIGDYATFTIGPFSLSRPAGDDAIAVGKEIMRELTAMADEAFAAQSHWYFRKLKMIDDQIEAWEKKVR